MMDHEILGRFHSKRNGVYLVRLCEEAGGRLAVLKEYGIVGQELAEREYDNILKLKAAGMSVPEIIYKGSGIMLLEHIKGELVSDLVEKLDTGEWIDGLALWLSKLHSIREGKACLLKGDINLRNFIYCSGQIYGLDFESTACGDPRTDLGNLCFFILTNTPAFKAEKRIMIRRLLDSYEKYSGTKPEAMGRYLLQSRAEAKIRRRKTSGYVLR